AAALLAVTGVYTIASQLALTRLRSAAGHANWAAALHDANRASALAPWSSQPWLALGEADLRAGRLPEARDALLEATAASPHDWTAWADLAEATWGPERAHALARAAALNPLGAAP